MILNISNINLPQFLYALNYFSKSPIKTSIKEIKNFLLKSRNDQNFIENSIGINFNKNTIDSNIYDDINGINQTKKILKYIKDHPEFGYNDLEEALIDMIESLGVVKEPPAMGCNYSFTGIKENIKTSITIEESSFLNEGYYLVNFLVKNLKNKQKVGLKFNIPFTSFYLNLKKKDKSSSPFSIYTNNSSATLSIIRKHFIEILNDLYKKI